MEKQLQILEEVHEPEAEAVKAYAMSYLGKPEEQRKCEDAKSESELALKGGAPIPIPPETTMAGGEGSLAPGTGGISLIRMIERELQTTSSGSETYVRLDEALDIENVHACEEDEQRLRMRFQRNFGARQGWAGNRRIQIRKWTAVLEENRLKRMNVLRDLWKEELGSSMIGGSRIRLWRMVKNSLCGWDVHEWLPQSLPTREGMM